VNDPADHASDASWIDAVAAEAVAWVQPALPDGVVLSTTGAGPSLHIEAEARDALIPTATFAFGELTAQPAVESRAHGARIALTSFLNGLQDWVVLNTRDRWPGADNDADRLHAQHAGAAVTVFFGPETAPTFTPLSIEVPPG